MGLGSYIAGMFKKKHKQTEVIGFPSVQIKEIPVLLPVPFDLQPSDRVWERADAENLDRFLSSDSGALFQQYLALRYAKALVGQTECGWEQSKGMQAMLKTIRELSNPAAYGSSELRELSRINTEWGSGITPRNK